MEQEALATFLPLCWEKGIGIILGGPYNSGILARGPVEGATWNYDPAPAAVMDRVRRIEAVCRRHGVPMAAAALQFPPRSEEHTSELQSLMRISYAVFCLKKKKT